MKVSKYFLVFLLVFCFGYYFLKKRPFRIFKIYFPEYYLSNKTSDENSNFKILDQEYNYLDKGAQFFVFESLDKQYVIKFLRSDKLNFTIFSQLPGICIFQKNKQVKKKKRFIKALNSLKLATCRKSDFGVVLDNLDGKLFKQSLIVKDKSQNYFKINLDRTIFLVQKKVVKLKEALQNTVKNKQIIDNFLEVIFKRLNRKIYNNTQKCIENVGVLNDMVIEYDIGDLYYLKELEDDNMQKIHFKIFSNNLKQYLIEKFPDLVSYFEEKRNNYLLCNQVNKNDSI